MSHPTLKILGYSEAAMFLRSTPAPNVVAVISIHGSREFGVEAIVAHRLDLQFDDVEVPAPDDTMSMLRSTSRKRWSEQNGLAEIATTLKDAAAVIEFAKTIKDVQGIVLCHCGAGMSRATAAALVCLSVWRGPGTEDECVAEVRQLRRGAVPHTGFIRFADVLLGRNNRLSRALLAS